VRIDSQRSRWKRKRIGVFVRHSHESPKSNPLSNFAEFVLCRNSFVSNGLTRPSQWHSWVRPYAFNS
jgi:hypothetical protein